MTNETRDFARIPQAACTLTVGPFVLGDNGEGARSAPIRLVARSGKPIEHWWWGRVVHDLAGMHMHKSRLPVDYVHDPKEVIGYLNRFDIETGDLVASGALVPYGENDRATEIIHKAGEGVPYEASINFGGDGIKVQEIAEGEVAEVNGGTFEGPGVIVREWPLRGVAICPYGADMNTESKVLSADRTFAAAVIAEPEPANEETAAMTTETVDDAARTDDPQAEEKTELTETEEQPVEAAFEATEREEPEAELAETPEPETPEDEPAELAAEPEAPEAPAPAEGEALAEGVEEEPKPELSREEFTRIADEFGSDIAVQTVRDGGNYETALKLAYEAEKGARAAAEQELAEFRASAVGAPAPVSDASKEKQSLFNTGK
jgi:hypothetical protein